VDVFETRCRLWALLRRPQFTSDSIRHGQFTAVDSYSLVPALRHGRLSSAMNRIHRTCVYTSNCAESATLPCPPLVLRDHQARYYISSGNECLYITVRYTNTRVRKLLPEPHGTMAPLVRFCSPQPRTSFCWKTTDAGLVD